MIRTKTIEVSYGQMGCEKCRVSNIDNFTDEFSQKEERRNGVVVGGLYWDEGRF